MIFISPPFGNYISLPYCKSIKGSYTLNNRPGLFKQIYNTLYFDSSLHGWVNKIGLRNPGIDYAIQHYNHNTDIISIAILDQQDIPSFLQKIPDNTNLEINISCPNINKQLVQSNLQSFLNNKRQWCIIKCSPLIQQQQLDHFYNIGFRQFHFSNTLPVPNGGLSGPKLIPYTQKLSQNMKNKYNDVTIISGGGIQSWQDLINYNFADHHSISTIFFSPLKLIPFFYKYYTK